MHIVILTQYFPPEVGAPQNRLFELAVRLKEKGAEVSILTAMPNYPQMEIYHGYRGKFYIHESTSGMEIYRSWIYVTQKKNILARLINYFSFVKTSFWTGLFVLKNVDIVLCESPPLFLGISAYALKVIKGAKLIFNVSDLWPESAEKLGLVTNQIFLNAATKLEEFMYRNSDLITGQTQGIVKNISSRFPDKKVRWIPNGVDLTLYQNIQSDWSLQNNFLKTDFLILYAGILGHAQGLEVIIHAASRLKEYPSIKFILLGSGPEKQKLLDLKRKKETYNVHFFDTVNKEKMPAIIAAASCAVVPLKRLELFKGAIPSKIFENMAMKKPILLGVEGEAKSLFIEQGQSGLAFTPEDDGDLAIQVLQLYSDKDLSRRLGENGFNYVKANFTRDKIASDFWNYLSEIK